MRNPLGKFDGEVRGGISPRSQIAVGKSGIRPAPGGKRDIRKEARDYLRFLGISRDRLLAGPRQVFLSINTECSNRCVFCSAHSPLVGVKGVKPARLDFSQVKKIVDQAVLWGSEDVVLTGLGEPTLHPEFGKIARYVRGKGFLTTLTTNGLFEARHLPAIAAIDYVLVNLSAPDEALYGGIQSPNSKGSYKRAIKNIAALVGFRKSAQVPRIRIIFVVNSLNYRSIPLILKTAGSLGVHEVCFKMMEYTRDTQRLLLSKRQGAELLSIIEGEMLKSPSVENNLDEIKRTLLDYRQVYGFRHCYAGWFMVEVDPFGVVRVCCTNEETVVGNIKDDSIGRIWASPRAHKMRLRLKRKIGLDKQPALGYCRWCFWKESNIKIARAVRNLQARHMSH